MFPQCLFSSQGKQLERLIVDLGANSLSIDYLDVLLNVHGNIKIMSDSIVLSPNWIISVISQNNSLGLLPLINCCIHEHVLVIRNQVNVVSWDILNRKICHLVHLMAINLLVSPSVFQIFISTFQHEIITKLFLKVRGLSEPFFLSLSTDSMPEMRKVLIKLIVILICFLLFANGFAASVITSSQLPECKNHKSKHSWVPYTSAIKWCK